jgi:CheY-like chemotaxis protein
MGSVQIVQLKDSDTPSVTGRRILLVGAERSVQGLISTFLLTTGWTCTVVQNKQEMSAILQWNVFDAVVIDLGRSVAEAEEAIHRLEQIRPSLVGRILAISNQGTDWQMRKLIERHDLIQLSHSCRGSVPNEHFARIVFALVGVLTASHPVPLRFCSRAMCSNRPPPLRRPGK